MSERILRLMNNKLVKLIMLCITKNFLLIKILSNDLEKMPKIY